MLLPHRRELLESWDLVIIARRGAADLKLQAVDKELGQLRDWLNRRSKTPRRETTQ